MSLRQLRLFKEKLRGKSRKKEDNKNTAFKNVKEAHPSKKKKPKQTNEQLTQMFYCMQNKEIL